MSTKQDKKKNTEQEEQRRSTRNASIGKHVLHLLGISGDHQKVQVRPLWDDRFRVNVFVGEDAVSIKIAHSYFLVADNDGNILSSAPPITVRP